MGRRRFILIYAAFYMLFGSMVARSIGPYWNTPSRGFVFITLLIYALLLAAEPWLTSRQWKLFHLYVVVQCGLVLALLFIPERNDFFANLFIPLCFQAIYILPRKVALAWVGTISVCILTSLLYLFGWVQGLAFALSYLAACFFVSAFGIVTLRAEEAQQKTQALLGELQSAHEKLQASAAQVEELAAAQERNRLARELHDSVTQTIFSITLTAQAARILLERDQARTAAQLDHLQELAQNALSEMRSLIQHLRPKSAAGDGLVAVLKNYLAERQAQDGLQVDLQVEGERRLPVQMEETLFRVIQEALNNVVKHAHCQRATVRLCLQMDPASIMIQDDGRGFDPDRVGNVPGHLGLASMSERVQSLGAQLKIESSPGAGTCVRVENLKLREE